MPRVVAPALWLLVAWFSTTNGMVIQQMHGANNSELSHCSSAGGCHVYLKGVDLGGPFSPPKVYVGHRFEIECVVQPRCKDSEQSSRSFPALKTFVSSYINNSEQRSLLEDEFDQPKAF